MVPTAYRPKHPQRHVELSRYSVKSDDGVTHDEHPDWGVGMASEKADLVKFHAKPFASHSQEIFGVFERALDQRSRHLCKVVRNARIGVCCDSLKRFPLSYHEALHVVVAKPVVQGVYI